MVRWNDGLYTFLAWNNIVKDNSVPYIGVQNSTNVIIEFFDYRCGVCKKFHSELEKLKNDLDFKVILMHVPVLGEKSEFLAKLSLAAYQEYQDPVKFSALYNELINLKKYNDRDIRNVFTKLNLDYSKVKKISQDKKFSDMIQANFKLGASIGMRGVPGLIINGKFYGGFKTKNELKGLFLK